MKRQSKRTKRYVFANPKPTKGRQAGYWAARVAEDLDMAGDKLSSRLLLESLQRLRWAMDDVSVELSKVIRKERQRG
jgi:hypothetical protein